MLKRFGAIKNPRLDIHTAYLSGQVGELHYPEAVFRRREVEPGEHEEGVQSELSPQLDNVESQVTYRFPLI